MAYLWRKIKTIPYLGKFIASVYYSMHKTRKKICGKDNHLQIHVQGSLPILKNVIFKINGDGNTIIIKSGVRLSDTKIEIEGDRNRILIEENCCIKGGSL